MLRIGVLSLQGSYVEHLKCLSGIPGITSCEVKTQKQLNEVSGIIIPGGESTTIGKLLVDYNLKEPIIDAAKCGMPVWGTCAGMILMAGEVIGEEYTHLGIMDIAVKRNAYGSQLESFNTVMNVNEVSDNPIPLVFIRAPQVQKVWGEAHVMASMEGKAVAVRQKNLLATSFHPELTDDLSFHKYFVDMAKKKC
ncbi:MAG TPA: pyridoxal 5'-phosphate synthase glutaminase subunit PdxT [Clostridia bacterium]